MPTIDQWYQVYDRQATALQAIAADVKKLAAAGGGGGGGGGDAFQHEDLSKIADRLSALRTELVGQFGGAVPELPRIRQALQAISTDLAGAALLLSTEGADSQIGVVAARLQALTAATQQVAAALAGDPVAAAADLDVARLTAQALKIDLKPGSLSPAEARAAFNQAWADPTRSILAQAHSFAEGTPMTGAIARGVETVVKFGANLAEEIMAPLQVPFRAILHDGIDRLIATLKAAHAAHPTEPDKVAIEGILSAHRLGQEAHALASAVELHPLFHQLGFSHMAAAVVDLSGFAPLSQAALRPHIEAAIARPMRYSTNEQYTPYIPGENTLADHVRRRTLTLTDYDRWLAKLGYAETHRDRMIETVWRDPTVRDLALALEDAAVDEPWLLRRVRTAGYDDEDADQITRGLVQRANKASRERLRAQAAGAWAEGTISGEEYETLLADVGLSAEAMRWERRAAELQRRRDAVKDALATYLRQYVDGTLGRDDYLLAVTALGVDPERQASIVADADARRAPRIQRQEEAAVASALSELRRELVPRYRQLYTLGLVGSEEYQRMLEQAGIAPAVAAQAVSLDASRRRAAAAVTGSAAAERQLAETLRERQDLAIQRYRRGQLTDEQLAAALLAAGRPPDQVDVLVARERLARVPILARPPAIGAEAVDRLTPEFRRRAALEDYRAGRIDEDALYDELLAVGRTADQAEAEVGYELARRPPPKG